MGILNLDLSGEELLLQLEIAYREIVACQLYGELNSQQEQSVQYLAQAMNLVSEEVTRALPRQYQTYSLCSGGRGRPRFDIPRYQITSLLEIRFTVPSVALILGVLIRTVRRRMSDYNLAAVKVYYSDITDEQLDKIVEEIQMQFPTCGNKQMVGHLQSRGVRVTQLRIRESQRRVDPEGSVMRRLKTINRRQYHVSGPGALLHIDGHHKLIRYCIVLC